MEKNKDDQKMMEICKTLGHPVRFQIISTLLRHEEQYCGDLVKLVGLAQSTVSHHLKILRDAGLVDTEEKGTWVCYRVNLQKLRDLSDFLAVWGRSSL